VTLVKIEKRKSRKTIPKVLIYEMRYGSPIYYQDYKKVLSGELPPEAIMGSSNLQAWIIDVIVRFLHKALDSNKYQILYSEVGFKFAPRSWYNLDIAIWNKEKLLKEGLKNTYSQVPPEVVIEIDIKVDLERFSTPAEYYHIKIQDLLDSGVKGVVWIFTKSEKVWIAEKDKPWIITDWNCEIPVIENISFNLKEFAEKNK